MITAALIHRSIVKVEGHRGDGADSALLRFCFLPALSIFKGIAHNNGIRGCALDADGC